MDDLGWRRSRRADPGTRGEPNQVCFRMCSASSGFSQAVMEGFLNMQILFLNISYQCNFSIKNLTNIECTSSKYLKTKMASKYFSVFDDLRAFPAAEQWGARKPSWFFERCFFSQPRWWLFVVKNGIVKNPSPETNCVFGLFDDLDSFSERNPEIRENTLVFGGVRNKTTPWETCASKFYCVVPPTSRSNTPCWQDCSHYLCHVKTCPGKNEMLNTKHEDILQTHTHTHWLFTFFLLSRQWNCRLWSRRSGG